MTLVFSLTQNKKEAKWAVINVASLVAHQKQIKPQRKYRLRAACDSDLKTNASTFVTVNFFAG